MMICRGNDQSLNQFVLFCQITITLQPSHLISMREISSLITYELLYQIDWLDRQYKVRLIQYLNLKMESSDFEEKAIHLVYVTSEGKYELHPEAEEFLKKVPKPISVISVAGLYRTGKSYLLNRILLNRNNGFGVGPTINPCTKGLWCWGTPLKGTSSNGQKINILIVDSEGIGALDEDQNHDIKIFTLAILTSSIFIYNSVGSIDENALQNLSLVVNLTKNIQLNTQQNIDEDDPEELARYFPTFYWVVRDFALQLVSQDGEAISPKDYLERALAPQKGFSDDIEEKNRIRRLLTTFFKQRECTTLVRPLVNEQKLQHLYECSFDDLRPEFVEQALNLRKRVLTNAKPKMLKGEHLDGLMYMSMLNSYLTAINSGGVPNIENAWTYMCIEKCMKLQEQCYDFFMEQINQNLKENIPCSVDDFESQIEAIENECYKIFQREQIGEESKEYLIELKLKIKDKVNTLRLENERQSINVLKNYIIKNFGVIQKKMRMNEYQNFQEFLKSVNNFYMHLLENGPDLPKKEIVYLDFLKKVTSQGAEIFLKQANQSLDNLKTSSQQKQKSMKVEIDQLKSKMNRQISKFQEKLENMTSQKYEAQKRLKQTMQILEDLKQSSKSQMNKLESGYENKLKVLQIKLGQMSITVEDLKQKKLNLESLYMVEKKQREKEKAITELRLNQYKQQTKVLKIKEKSQEMQISDLQSELSSKMREIAMEHQKKSHELANEVKAMTDKYNEAQQGKEALEIMLKRYEHSATVASRKHQEQMKAQIEKFENYRITFESDKLVKIQMLEQENKDLKQQLEQLKLMKTQANKVSKELIDKLKTTSSDYEKELAILNQKMTFLVHQLNQNKENHGKSVAYYESLLKSRSQMYQEEISKNYKEKMADLEESLTYKNRQLEQELLSLRETYESKKEEFSKMEETMRFERELELKKHETQITNKNNIIELLEEEKLKLYSAKNQGILQCENEFRLKETFLMNKIKQIESQLENAYEKASEEQSEYSNKSEESLKQLKNYYELQKQKLEQKITLEKDKYQKKIEKIRDEYENQIEQERRNAEEEYDNLRDQYTNETTVLKGLVDSLQHENDTKTKTIQTLQKRCLQEKERLDKKQHEFNNRLDLSMKNSAAEKEVLQNKIFEINEQKATIQKEVMMLNHYKDQLTKQMKELASKFQAKVEQTFYLNKNLQKISNESRQKLNDLNNEYMNEKLNYEKKIALCEQEKEFFAKKMEDYEREHSKNSVGWDEKIKKMKQEYSQQMKELQTKKDAEYKVLQAKLEKLKKSSKENEQQMSKTITTLEKDLAIIEEKYSNISSRYQDLEEKKSIDSDHLLSELNQTKQKLAQVSKDLKEENAKLKKELIDMENDKNQIESRSQREKILMENKNNFLEEIREKNKKQYLQKIKNLEIALESIQKARASEKTYYQNLISENTNKLEKKYNSIIQENNENWSKKEKDMDSTIKKHQAEIRNLTEKMAIESQSKQETIKSNERKIRELQDSEKRALSELQKYKASKETLNSENASSFEKERDNAKQKMQQKEEKIKNLEKAKHQLYYEFEKEKARWSLQKDNYLTKNDELKDMISKYERDIEKLQRQNEKLKVEKKCNNKMNGSGFSRYSFEKANSKYNLQDSLTSISMSITKENSNPLGEISFFNN